MASTMLLPSYHVRYSLTLENRFDVNSIADVVKEAGCTIMSIDKAEILFRMPVYNSYMSASSMIGSYIDVLVQSSKDNESTCEVDLTFSSFKKITTTLFSMIIFGGVILQLPINPTEAIINLVLVLLVWRITTFIDLMPIYSRVVKPTVDALLLKSR